MVGLSNKLSECQRNVGNHICINRFYYNYKNGPINQIIERHYAQISLKSHCSSSSSSSKRCEDCKDRSDNDSKDCIDCNITIQSQ